MGMLMEVNIVHDDDYTCVHFNDGPKNEFWVLGWDLAPPLVERVCRLCLEAWQEEQAGEARAWEEGPTSEQEGV